MPRVEVEALFADGSRLLVLHDPIGAVRAAAARRSSRCPWGRSDRHASRSSTRATCWSGVTSHFHFFEVNRALRFDRAAAWGMRLAVPAGREGLLRAGRAARPCACARSAARASIRGHGGLVDGPLDAPGAREAALALARERGYRGA